MRARSSSVAATSSLISSSALSIPDALARVSRAWLSHTSMAWMLFPRCLAVLLLLLELDELEVVLGDDEARPNGADPVRLELAHRVHERLARILFVLGHVGASRRAGLEPHVGLPHRSRDPSRSRRARKGHDRCQTPDMALAWSRTGLRRGWLRRPHVRLGQCPFRREDMSTR